MDYWIGLQDTGYSDEDVFKIVKYFLVDAHSEPFLNKKRNKKRQKRILNLSNWSRDPTASKGTRETANFLFGKIHFMYHFIVYSVAASMHVGSHADAHDALRK